MNNSTAAAIDEQLAALTEPRPQPEPHPIAADGSASIGRYADSSDVPYAFWGDRGAVHDLITGMPGAAVGVSNLLRILLRHEQDSPLIRSWFLDGLGGHGVLDHRISPEMAATNPKSISTLLASVLQVVEGRREIGGVTAEAEFAPTADRPLVSITIADAHHVLDDWANTAICEQIVRYGRGTGVKLRLATAGAGLRNFGGSDIIRNAVGRGNVIAFRDAGRAGLVGTAHVLGLPGDPADLPAVFPDGSPTSGLAYTGGTLPRGLMRVWRDE